MSPTVPVARPHASTNDRPVSVSHAPTLPIPVDEDAWRRAFRARYGYDPRPRTAAGLSAEQRVEWLNRAAAGEREALPRWNPDGIRNNDLELAVVNAVYQATARWRGMDHWLSVVIPRALEANPDVLAGRVRRERFIAIMHAHALYARKDGRDCIVRPDTIAALVGCSERSVQYARAAAKRLGIIIEALPGRMLDLGERLQARDRGSRQRGLSAVLALVIPADIDPRVEPVDNPPVENTPRVRPHSFTCTPSRGPRSSLSRHVYSVPSPAWRPGTKVGAPRRVNQPARPGTATSFAQHLARHVPWLRTTPAQRLAALVRPFMSGPFPWQPAELASAMRICRPFPPATSIIHAPISLLAWYLRQLDPTDSPARNADRASALNHELARAKADAVPMPDWFRDANWLAGAPSTRSPELAPKGVTRVQGR